MVDDAHARTHEDSRTPGSVPALFESFAHSHADRVAVSCRLGEITYGALNEHANRIARRLLERGDTGDRIALLMPQDRRIFAAMIGLLKAGRIALVLNRFDPEVRLRQLLADAEPTTILTVEGSRALAEAIAGTGIEVIDIERFSEDATADDLSGIVIRPDDTAFLVYTSGSTGRPKGVMQTHGHTLRDAADVVGELGIGPDDRIVLLASLWGAQAVSTTFIALLTGALLVSFPVVENGTNELARILSEQRVTVFVAASSLFRHFVKALVAGDRFPAIRLVKLSADTATDEDLAAVGRYFPAATLVNAMGCSECGHLTYALYRPGATIETQGALSVGRPFPGVALRIVDGEGRPRSVGSVGTISASIRHLAAGYWRDPELTARHFFDGADGMRTFRGGDAASIDASGRMRLAGRTDATYKIRGQRVDLAEVERGVAALRGVADVAAVAAARSNEDLHLVAFVVPTPGWRVSPRTVRNAARATMPRHQVPSLFVIVEDLPRTANGKVDRAHLRAHVPWPSATEGDAAETPTETLLARLWGEALDLDGVGRSDDFFDLGGDSLTGTVIAAKLHGENRIAIDFAAFVQHPVLSDLAAFIDAAAPAAIRESPLTPVRPDVPVPLAPSQEVFLFDARHPTWGPRHLRSAAGCLTGPLDVTALNRSLDAVVARHDILRTCFVPAGETTVLVVDPPGKVPLPLTDLTGDEDAEGRLAQMVRHAGETLFDLAAEPAVRFKLVRLAPDRHALIQSSHHIAVDGPSWNIFLDDLAHFYEAFAAGAEPTLPSLSIEYRDYAAWERKRWRPEGEELDRFASWWSEQYAPTHAFADLKILEPYVRRARVGDLDIDDWRLPLEIDGETSGRLEQLRQEETATYYVVRLAAAVPLIAATIGRDTIPIQVYFTNRTRPEIQNMFGPFTNQCTLLFTCDPDMSFRELVRDVHAGMLAARPWSEIPYFVLTAALKARAVEPPTPLFAVHLQTPVPRRRFAGLDMTWRDRIWYPMPRGIVISLNEINEQCGSSLMFAARMYATELMRGFSDCLEAFVRAAAKDPDANITELIERSGVAGRLLTRRIADPGTRPLPAAHPTSAAPRRADDRRRGGIDPSRRPSGPSPVKEIDLP